MIIEKAIILLGMHFLQFRLHLGEPLLTFLSHIFTFIFSLPPSPTAFRRAFISFSPLPSSTFPTWDTSPARSSYDTAPYHHRACLWSGSCSAGHRRNRFRGWTLPDWYPSHKKRIARPFGHRLRERYQNFENEGFSKFSIFPSPEEREYRERWSPSWLRGDGENREKAMNSRWAFSAISTLIPSNIWWTVFRVMRFCLFAVSCILMPFLKTDKRPYHYWKFFD